MSALSLLLSVVPLKLETSGTASQVGCCHRTAVEEMDGFQNPSAVCIFSQKIQSKGSNGVETC